MYGIINKSIQDLVLENFGTEKWEIIRTRCGIEDDFFISNEAYDDEITYQLANAISEEMQLSVGTVLFTFGEWWVLRTSKERYGSLMEAGGNNLREFLINLPIFHNRIMLIYPKLTPPEFKVSHVEENSLHLHYLSSRLGLEDFVSGLLHGLGKLYQAPVQVELIESKEKGNTHAVYKVAW